MKKVNRRQFLTKAAGVSSAVIGFPYLVWPSALGKAGSVAASERITIGFIGVGGHGRAVNLTNFLGNADAQAVAVCDVDTNNRNIARDMVNQKYGNKDCATYNDFRKIIERDDIDAVMISTPDHWHVPISIAAAKAGKDVECEKPTLTVEEGRVLCETMKRYNRVFQWSTEDRSVDVYHRMCELVRNGRIGKVHTIRVELPSGPDTPGDPTPMPIPEGFDYEMWLGPAPYAPYTKDRIHWNFRWILDYSGGQLTDWGAHLLDGAQWGNDSEHTGPVEVEGKGVFCSEGLYDTAKEYRIEYKYANGVRLIVTSGNPSLRFEGSEGWIGNVGWRGKLQAEHKKILDSVIGPNEIHLYTCRAGEQRNFLDCVKSRQDCYFPPEIGHRCFTIAHIGNISMLLGRKLKWDSDKERFINDEQANRMLSRSMRSPWHL
ncbi:MAG TPA: Gfo/Idh/MocA family oxidoreductase [Sedimentisphaerales bacterium]|nr:Gfo/Idh/MocA family oxidoreductase [Sedimentisphaerales bacterium]